MRSLLDLNLTYLNLQRGIAAKMCKLGCKSKLDARWRELIIEKQWDGPVQDQTLFIVTSNNHGRAEPGYTVIILSAGGQVEGGLWDPGNAGTLKHEVWCYIRDDWLCNKYLKSCPSYQCCSNARHISPGYLTLFNVIGICWHNGSSITTTAAGIY